MNDYIEFNDAELDRMDTVDNAIFNLLCDLAPEDAEFDWDIEPIAEIREIIIEYFERLGIMTEAEFYPYREL